MKIYWFVDIYWFEYDRFVKENSNVNQLLFLPSKILIYWHVHINLLLHFIDLSLLKSDVNRSFLRFQILNDRHILLVFFIKVIIKMPLVSPFVNRYQKFLGNNRLITNIVNALIDLHSNLSIDMLLWNITSQWWILLSVDNRCS